jgi:hypothetical protein
MSAAIIGDSWSLEVMACRGICERHRASKPADIRLSRYMVGQKRCQACMMFIIWPVTMSLLWLQAKNTSKERNGQEVTQKAEGGN